MKSFFAMMVSAVVLIGGLWPTIAGAQATGGGGSNGGGFLTNISDRGCEEGRRQIDWILNKSGERVMVILTCRDGSYFDLTNYIYDPLTQCPYKNSGIIRRLVKTRSGKIERRPYRCIDYRWYEVKE